MTESLSQAYSRYYWWRKNAQKYNRRKKVTVKTRVPLSYMQMTGETQIELDKLPPVFYKKVMRSLTSGYLRARSGMWPDVASFIADHSLTPFKLGYVGKTNFEVWFHKDDGREPLELMKAQLMMSETFKHDKLRQVDQKGDWVLLDIWLHRSQQYDHETGTTSQGQLASQFDDLLGIVDDSMAASLHRRQAAIDMLTNGDTVVVPFAYMGEVR